MNLAAKAWLDSQCFAPSHGIGSMRSLSTSATTWSPMIRGSALGVPRSVAKTRVPIFLFYAIQIKRIPLSLHGGSLASCARSFAALLAEQGGWIKMGPEYPRSPIITCVMQRQEGRWLRISEKPGDNREESLEATRIFQVALKDFQKLICKTG